MFIRTLTIRCDGPCNLRIHGDDEDSLWALCCKWGWRSVDGMHLCPVCFKKGCALYRATQHEEKR